MAEHPCRQLGLARPRNRSFRSTLIAVLVEKIGIYLSLLAV